MKEPYIKEKNTVQLPLFYFGSKRPFPIETCHNWKDEFGECKVICHCSYGVPSRLEQDVYTAIARMWFKKNLPLDGIYITYSDIARELGLKPANWTYKISCSIQKLAQARYTFTQSFLALEEGELERVSTHFSLFDSVRTFKHKKREKGSVKLIFPQEVQGNLGKKYYQTFDMSVYRQLPKDLSRRMYEFLEKRRHPNSSSTFQISEDKLCLWLPAVDKNVTKRKDRIKNTAQKLVEVGYLKSHHRTDGKVWVFEYSSSVRKEINCIEKSIVMKNSRAREAIAQHRDLFDLVKIKKISPSLKLLISEYVRNKGDDYIKSAISYTNKYAKWNYEAFLKKCLAESWFESCPEWKSNQEKLARDQEQRKVIENIQEERIKSENLEAEQDKFKTAFKLIPCEVRQKIWEETSKSKDCSKRMDFCLLFSEKILEYLNFTGEIFPANVIDLKMAIYLSKDFDNSSNEKI